MCLTTSQAPLAMGGQRTRGPERRGNGLLHVAGRRPKEVPRDIKFWGHKLEA